jgi:hypothetical protein
LDFCCMKFVAWLQRKAFVFMRIRNQIPRNKRNEHSPSLTKHVHPLLPLQFNCL